MSQRIHDVIVIGAGPGGSAVASMLSSHGLDVLLLDKHDFPRDKTCGDALSPRALRVLDSLGVGTEVNELGYRIDSLTVTGPKGEQASIPFPSHPEFSNHGLVLRRLQLDDLILQQAQRAGAEFRADHHVQLIAEQDEGVLVAGSAKSDEFQLRARIGILAVGANMGLLRKLDLLPAKLDLNLAARGYFDGLRELSRTIHIRFDGMPLPGYGWIFPLSNHEANIGAGFAADQPSAPKSAAAAMDAFLERKSIRRQLAGGRQVGAVKGFPLRTDFHRSPTYRGRILLVGEAAGLVNPFTGEGVDYALESAELATNAVTATLAGGQPLATSLRQYDRALRQRFQATFVWTHLMRRLYMRPAFLDPLIEACRTWPEVAETLVRVLLAYQHPARALAPDILLRTLWASLRSKPLNA